MPDKFPPWLLIVGGVGIVGVLLLMMRGGTGSTTGTPAVGSTSGNTPSAGSVITPDALSSTLSPPTFTPNVPPISYSNGMYMLPAGALNWPAGTRLPVTTDNTMASQIPWMDWNV